MDSDLHDKKGWRGHAPNHLPRGNRGLYHQHLESLNTTNKEILMGIMPLTIRGIGTDPPLGERTRMDRVDQGILLVKIRITDFINVDHHLQTQEAL